MTNSEKIEKKKQEILNRKKKIALEHEKISKLEKEIETLESLEVKAMLKEINLPLDEVKALIKTMKSTPIVNSKNEM